MSEKTGAVAIDISPTVTVQDVMMCWWRDALNAGWDVEYRNRPNFKGLPLEWERLSNIYHEFNRGYEYRLVRQKETN